MPLKATLLKWLKLFGGDTRRAIVSYIVAGLILAGGGVLVLTKTALAWVIQIANIPTPLWATILLILLCGLYTYVKAAKLLSKLNQKGQASKTPPQYSEYQPTPGVFVYVYKTSIEPNIDWYCKHCADIERTQSTLQMVHHSAAGKRYQCHKCKFSFLIPYP